MLRLIFLSIILILCIENITAARILAVFPTPSISHQVVFRPLVHELVRRGHQVTLVTTDPAFPPGQAPSNLTEIDVHDISYKVWADEFLKATIEKDDDMSNQINVIINTVLKVTTTQMEVKEVQDIINKKNGEYDLLLLEAYVQPALIYSHIFKVPVILMSSLGCMKYNYRAVGASTHPLLYPILFHQKLYNLSKWDKLQQLLNHWRVENIVWENEQESDRVMKSKFGPDTPTIYELSNNVDMLFLNVNPTWVDNHPVPPSVVYMGGIHMTPDKDLPKDLQTYLDSSKNGVVYFSFGTNVKTSALPPTLIQTFTKAFSKLPFDVLWKWDQDELPGKSKNIKIMQWLPQSDILRHPNVKVFITQGGLQSTDEAINAGVPLIGIPLLADQWYNVQKYVRHEIGIQLDVATVSEDELRKAIETIAGDKRYRENIKRLRTIIKDQPQTPLERAVWWTEHVIRHGGAGHLRAAGANITWSQYLELELVLIVLSALLFVLLIILTSIFGVWRLIRQKLGQNTKRKLA